MTLASKSCVIGRHIYTLEPALNGQGFTYPDNYRETTLAELLPKEDDLLRRSFRYDDTG